jgi:hypothetical protein
MTGKLSFLFLGLLLSLIGGCANRPVFSVEVYGTPTPYDLFPNSSPIAPDNLAASATASLDPLPPDTAMPVFTQAPAALPLDFSPILYGEKYDAGTFFFLLGGVQAGEWITPEQTASLIPGTSEYDIHTSDREMFQVLGYAPESGPIHPGQYTIGSDSNRDDIGMLGVAHGWPVRQGQVEELASDSEIYRQVVLDWLKEAGIQDPQPGTMHIFRVDLEDDGVDEIFISAAHLDESKRTTTAGDYSIILMRKVVGSVAVTQPLVADLYRSKDAGITYPLTYLISSFMDLDQDHVLEVVISYHGWEKDGAMIYTIHGQDVAQVP